MALEAQRSQDHAVMQDMINAIMQLRAANEQVVTKVDEHDGALRGQTKMGMQLRKEVFAARSELAAGVSGASDAAQAAVMAQMAVQIENKFSELDKLTQNLGNAVEMLGLREQRVEQVVSHQVAGQPQHEQVQERRPRPRHRPRDQPPHYSYPYSHSYNYSS